MRVTVLAHASVLVEMGDERVLVDPIFAEVFASGTLCFHPARRLDVERLLQETTLLVVTHIHLDHFHPETLARFERSLPVIVPAHAALANAIRALGFTRVIELRPWQRHPIADGFALATPSDFELEELGLVFERAGASYWHMSDAIVDEPVGRRVRETLGPVSLVAAKYQPLRTLIGYQRGLQSEMLDRDELVAGFEAACAVDPAWLFPYFSGFAFHGEHAWANRHVAPYRAGEIARLLRRRLGASATVDTVLPGDVLEVQARLVRKEPGASTLSAPLDGHPVQSWEPIDVTTLAGLERPAERVWLTLELRKLLPGEVMPWVLSHLSAASGLFDAYRELQVVWQCVVHVGEGGRLRASVDFRAAEPELRLDHEHPDANVFSHVSGRQLWRVLRGEAGAEVFWMAGGYRIYEKVLLVRDGRLAAPPREGWELFETLPDPLTHYLRKAGRRRLQ